MPRATPAAPAASPMTTETIGTGSRPVSPITPASAAARLRGIAAGSGIEPRCIDQGDDRQLEVTGQAQHPLRLAEGAGSRRLTALAGDERHRDAGDAAQPGDHRRIVVPGAVAVQLDPFRDQTGEVVAGARALGMAGQPRLLPPGNPAPRRDGVPASGDAAAERRGSPSVAGRYSPRSAKSARRIASVSRRLVRSTMPSSMPRASSSSAVSAALPAGVPPAGSDPGARLGQDDVGLVRQRRPGRAGGRVRQHADERHPGAVQTRRGGGDLGRLDQAQQAPPGCARRRRCRGR